MTLYAPAYSGRKAGGMVVATHKGFASDLAECWSCGTL